MVIYVKSGKLYYKSWKWCIILTNSHCKNEGGSVGNTIKQMEEWKI